MVETLTFLKHRIGYDKLRTKLYGTRIFYEFNKDYKIRRHFNFIFRNKVRKDVKVELEVSQQFHWFYEGFYGQLSHL